MMKNIDDDDVSGHDHNDDVGLHYKDLVSEHLTENKEVRFAKPLNLLSAETVIVINTIILLIINFLRHDSKIKIEIFPSSYLCTPSPCDFTFFIP